VGVRFAVEWLERWDLICVYTRVCPQGKYHACSGTGAECEASDTSGSTGTMKRCRIYGRCVGSLRLSGLGGTGSTCGNTEVPITKDPE
jgi:hypothetical protein